MSESTFVTSGDAYLPDQVPCDLLYPPDHHLRDPVPGMDRLLFLRQVNENDLKLSAIIRIDGARGIEAGDSMFEGQAAAGPHLRFIAMRQFDKEPGRDQLAFQGFQYDRSGKVGAYVHTGRTFCSIAGQLIRELIYDLDVDIRHGFVLLGASYKLRFTSPTTTTPPAHFPTTLSHKRPAL